RARRPRRSPIWWGCIMYRDDPFAPTDNDADRVERTTEAKETKTPIIPVPADAPVFSFCHPRHGEPVGNWPYYQAEGRLVGYAARFNFQIEGKPEKEVLPITYCSVKKGSHTHTAWRSCGVPAPRPLYRLAQLVAEPSEPIIVTEGEKKADRAIELF